jgi:hypothetical protein
VNVGFDPGQPVMIDPSVLVAALFNAGALGLEFLLQLVQQGLVGESLAGDGRGQPGNEGKPDAKCCGDTVFAQGRAQLFGEGGCHRCCVGRSP